jgi:alkanesulfonate monooxygenase SsuD/methylene tetrahydromethanopterin reductase-like flavin-dependent oxidoreductase (luciferase family)
MRLGTLVPHFGRFAGRDLIVNGARAAQAAGIESFWARDHLVWHPHGMEGSNRTFIDPFAALAAVAGAVDHATLGTAVAIPVRSPLMLAQQFLSLAALTDGDVIVGLGLGFDKAEFAAVGLNFEQRDEILTESVSILRKAFAGQEIDHHGDVFDFDAIALSPEMARSLKIIYGGDSQKAVRRAVSLADGWLPSRIPMGLFRKRLAYRATVTDKEQLLVVQPMTVVAESSAAASALVPWKDLAGSVSGSDAWDDATRSGEAGVEAFAGVVVCGDPDEVVSQILEYAELGADEYIFDLRLHFEHYLDVLALIGEQVVPKLRAKGVLG